MVGGRATGGGAGVASSQSVVRVMADDRRPVVAASSATARPPDDGPAAAGAHRHGGEPRQPAVAVQRVADERQRAQVGRQRVGAGRQRTVAESRQSVVVEHDSLKSWRVTRSQATGYRRANLSASLPACRHSWIASFSVVVFSVLLCVANKLARSLSL